MRTTRASLLLVYALIPGPALAQPTLDSLWPNANGLRWDYELTINDWLHGSVFTTNTARMTLVDSVHTMSGTAQLLHAWHDLPPQWRTLVPGPSPRNPRPHFPGVAVDTGWWPTLLSGGHFMKTESCIQVSQPAWDWSITLLTSDLSVGASFTHEAWPGDSSSGPVYVHATVEAVDAIVATPARTFTNAVRIRYVVDWGASDCVPADLACIVSLRHETRGHVHYVPDVGPVEMVQDFVLAEGDTACTWTWPCLPAACECCCSFAPGITMETMTLSLIRGPVGVAPTTWTHFKRLYR